MAAALRHSASLVLLRSSPARGRASTSFEVLLLLRNAKRRTSFPSMWVFPGGVAEPSDISLSSTALRETFEEVGLTVGMELPAGSTLSEVTEWRQRVYADPSSWASFTKWCGRAEAPLLAPFTKWTTPAFEKKRFTTAFFVGAVDEGWEAEGSVDGGEIVDHLWIAPDDAIARHCRGHLALMPPQLWMLSALSGARSITDAMRIGRSLERLPTIEPELHARSDDGTITLVLPWDEAHKAHPGEAGAAHRVSFVAPLGSSPVTLAISPLSTLRRCGLAGLAPDARM